MSREKPLLLQKWQFSRDIWLTLPHQLLLGEGWSSPIDLLCLIQVVVSVFSTYLKDFRQQPDWQTLAPVMFLSNIDWQHIHSWFAFCSLTSPQLKTGIRNIIYFSLVSSQVDFWLRQWLYPHEPWHPSPYLHRPESSQQLAAPCIPNFPTESPEHVW